MAPALIQAKYQYGFNSNAWVFAFANPNVAGNFLFVCIDTFGGLATINSIASGNGNTWQLATGSLAQVGLFGGSAMQIWYAENCKAGSESITINWSGGQQGGIDELAEYSGVIASGSFDNADNGNIGGGDMSATVALADTDDFCIAAYTSGAQAGIYAWQSPFAPDGGGNNTVAVAPTVASPGSITALYSGGTTAGYAMSIAGFQVALAAPVITGLSVNHGQWGDAVVITGTGFGSSQGGSTVTLNGISATASAWGDTSITITVPDGSATGNIVVTTGGGASNNEAFTVDDPSIASLSVNHARVGDSITITGGGFGASQGASTVKFNGTAGTPSAWSETSITVDVPVGATTGNIVVTTSVGASNGEPFTVDPPLPGAGSTLELTALDGVWYVTNNNGFVLS